MGPENNFSSRLGSGRLVFVLAACLCGHQAAAEIPVGFAARGLDPFYVLHNPGHLDVRDAWGRSVSALVVRREIKKAEARRREQAAFFSGLPRAGAVGYFLECLWTLSLFSWAVPDPWPLLRSFSALPAPRRRSIGALERTLSALARTSNPIFPMRSSSLLIETSCRSFVLLRC